MESFPEMQDNLTDVERVILQLTGRLERRLFVLVGPSGVGKNTIIRELLANIPVMARVVTYTTRPPRADEVEGEQYHFVTCEQFLALAAAGRLMEADAAGGHDVYKLGYWYSMPADIYEGIPPDKHVVIAEVDVVGARRLRQRYPHCTTIFVTAPPAELIRHIRRRHDDAMDAHSLAQRMETACEQIAAAGEFDYVVFNRDGHLSEAVQAIADIIRAERMRVREGFDLKAIFSADTFDVPPDEEQPS